MAERLPTNYADNDQWGIIINGYLSVEHETDGWLKDRGIFNVKKYGAAVDDVTDDATAINAAITAAYNAGGGTVLIPGKCAHSSTITLKAGVTLRGIGKRGSHLRRTGNFIQLTMYGTSSTNHLFGFGLRDITLRGGGFSATAVDVVYVSYVNINNVEWNDYAGIALDCVEVWDSRFTDIDMTYVAGTSGTTPAIYVRSGRASSGFGSSTDNSNQLFFTNIHIELFRAGAIMVDDASGFGNQCNGIWFTNVKCETGAGIAQTSPVITVASRSTIVNFKNIYCFVSTLASGSAIDVIKWDSKGPSSLRDVHIGNESAASINHGVLLGSTATDQTCVIENVNGYYITAPTSGSHVHVASGGQYSFNNIECNSLATALVGVTTGTVEQSPPIKIVAGAVSDANFNQPPPPGTLALDNTNGRLYVKKVDGTWHYTALT